MNTARQHERTIPSRASAALLMLLLATPAALAADRVENGKWESEITANGDTRTITYCITPAEAASLNGDSATGRDFAEKKAQKAATPCAYKSYQIMGDTVTYTMVCGNRTITDKTIYRGQTANGVKTITRDGQTVEMHLSSRRLGACP